jgi:hypothetical protein
MEEFIADLFRERRAEHRDRRREHQPRLVASAGMADGVDQVARAVEIDPVTLVELGLGLAGDDRREMKDHLRPVRDQRFRRAGIGEIGGHDADRDRDIRRLGGRHHVLQRHAGDFVRAEAAVAQQPFSQFAADHAGAPKNQNVQDPSPFELFYSVFKRSGNRFA